MLTLGLKFNYLTIILNLKPAKHTDLTQIRSKIKYLTNARREALKRSNISLARCEHLKNTSPQLKFFLIDFSCNCAIPKGLSGKVKPRHNDFPRNCWQCGVRHFDSASSSSSSSSLALSEQLCCVSHASGPCIAMCRGGNQVSGPRSFRAR